MDEINKPKRYSAVWDYFTRKPNYIASCNICKKDYSYRASLSNLTKHRLRKHMQEAGDDTTDYSDDDTSNHSNYFTKSFTKKDSDSQSTWQYFEILDDEKFVAKCKICEKEVSFEKVAQLAEHVKDHNTLVSDDEEWLENKEKAYIKHQGRRSNASAVWRFMEVVDEEARNATCLICRRQLSYMTGTSNLRKHIQRIHPHISIDENIDCDKKVIISTDGQLYEIATSDGEKDPIHTDEIYLDDTAGNDGNEIRSETPPPKRFKTIHKKIPKRNLVSKEPFQNSNTDILDTTGDNTSEKNTSKTESLRIFGQYVISLLQQLPEHVSDQLQSDFIKQIFSTKIALKTPYSVTLNEKPVTVTINNCTPNTIPEITVHNTSDVIVTENTERSVNTDVHEK